MVKSAKIIFLISLLATPLLFSQDAYLRISDYGSSVIRIGVPDFSNKLASYSAGWDSVKNTLCEVLRNDLSFSPYLVVSEPEFYPQKSLKDVKDINPFAWATAGIQAIVLGEFDTDGKKIGLKATLYSVSGSAKIFSKSYECDAVQSRRLVHRVADDVHKLLTGDEGVAQTQIAFVSTRYNGTKELYVCDYDGYAPRRITESKAIILSIR